VAPANNDIYENLLLFSSLNSHSYTRRLVDFERMRPLLCLLGECELTVDGSPVPFQLTRKLWYVLALVASSQNAQMMRRELSEAVWPLSDEKSRNVLLHNWRRAVVAASKPIIPDVPVLVTEDDVSITTKHIDIDYQECIRFAKIALSSDDAHIVLKAGTAFDAIAADKTLIPMFASSFIELREQFDKQRLAVLRRSWQAEAYLNPEAQALSSQFESRLRTLGDANTIGSPTLPFKSLISDVEAPTQKGTVLPAAGQLAACVIIGIIIAAPIVLGSRSTPQKQSLRVLHGSKVHKPVTDINRYVLFQLRDNRIQTSSATAICITPKNQIIAAGKATLTSGDEQGLLVMLSASEGTKWVTRLTSDKGITTTPKQIFSTEGGRIYVASELSADRDNARKLAPGSYLAVSVFSSDGQRLFERVHLGQIEQNASSPIRITSDLKGGIHAFALSAREHATVALHVPAGPPTNKQLAITGYPKGFRMTDAIADNKGHLFVLGHLPVKTSAGERLDWHIQAFDKAYKTLWSRDIAGDVHQADAPLRGVINAMGDLVAYGPLPAQNKRNRGHNVATMVTISPSSGEVILRNSFNFGVQDPNFALRPLTMGKSAAIAVLYQPPDASDSFSIHRFGIDTTDTALTMSMQFPGNKRINSIVSFYINSNGVVTSLLQRSKEKLSTTALTYVSMFIGRGIETGDLSASKSYAYNTGGGGLIAGHYDNQFCVYDFRKLQ